MWIPRWEGIPVDSHTDQGIQGFLRGYQIVASQKYYGFPVGM